MNAKKNETKKLHALREFGRKALTVLLTISMVTMNTPFAYAVEVLGDVEATSEANAGTVVDEGTVGGQQDDDAKAKDTEQGDDAGIDSYVDVDPDSRTSADADATIADQPAEPAPEDGPFAEVIEPVETVAANEVALALDFTRAYISYEGQAIGLPMTSLTVPAQTDFRFTAMADEGCVLKEVRYVLAGQTTVLEEGADGFYTIPASKVVSGITLQVVADGDPFQIDISADDIDVAQNEQSEFVYEDKAVKVTATLTDPTALPAGVEFKVTPITAKSKDYNYQAYLEALNNSAHVNEQLTEHNTLMYDVAFLTSKLDDDGNVVPGEYVEVQLGAGQVKLDIQFKKDQLSKVLGVDDSSEVQIAHLPLIDSVRSSVDTTADAKNISAQDVMVEEPMEQNADVLTQQVQMSLDSLSAVTLYRNASSGASSSGANEPNVEQSASEAQTDIATINESTNLADFLVNATFNAPQNANGKYMITPGSSYTFVLTFAERYNQNDVLQFPNSNENMTYTLPEGLEVANGHAGTFTINVQDGINTYSITDNAYQIAGGKLIVNLNSSDPYFSKLTAAPNARFTLSFQGRISEDATHILFADGVDKELYIDDSNSVAVSKKSSVNISGKTVTYEVSVRSTGHSQNVCVSDTITNTINGLLTLRNAQNKFSIRSSLSSHDVSGIKPTVDGDHFEYKIPEMFDGEVITIKYEAEIHPELLPYENGQYLATANNEVEAWSDGDPTHKKAPIETTINYTPAVSKSSGKVMTVDGNKQSIKWTLVANEKRIVSMADTTITDTIHSSSQKIMKFSGDGIVVEVKDNKNEVVRTDTVSWDQLENKTDATWSYKVPHSDAGKAYMYTITYYTEVDTTEVMSTTTVRNTVETNGGKTSSGTASVTPGNGVVDVSKEATNVDIENKKISWKVTFNVPAQGLTKAAFGDKYPQAWINNSLHEENILPGSVHVTGLINDEYLRVRQKSDGEIWLTLIKKVDPQSLLTPYNEETHVGYDSAARVRYVQRIKKNSEDPISAHETEGCDPYSEDRTIVLTFDTRLDDEWLDVSINDPKYQYLQTHTNAGRLQINNDPDKPVSASVAVVPPGIKKNATYVGSRTVNGVQLPVYKYEIILSGIESDDQEVTDDFDTSVLEYYTGTDGGASSWFAGYVFGGNIWDQSTRGGKFGLTYTATGIKLTTDSTSLPHINNSESLTQYYDKYKLVYYLTVKDENALKTIKARAAASDGGVYRIENSASFNGMTSGAYVTYEYQGLKKEILTSDDELKKTDKDIWADFRVTLNPGGQVLNGGEPLTMTDTVSNLSVDVTSIQANPSEGVSWDMTGNTVTYIIPDATNVVITYRARVIMATMPEVGGTQRINFSNRAEMKGYSDTIEKQAERSNNGAGTASVASIKLMKYEAGNMNKRLSGAKFQLQDQGGKPIRDKNGKAVEFVTDENGMITVRGDLAKYGWAITEGQKYYLEELEAPTGYMLSGFKYQFTVSADGTSDYDHYIYYSGDTMTAKNYSGTDVRVQKKWTDGNQRHNNGSVEVALQQKMGDGNWSNTIRVKTEDGWTDVPGRTLTLNKDNDWAGVFDKLPLEVPVNLNNTSGDDVAVSYQVVETKVNGRDPEDGRVTITGGKAEDSGTYVYEIENKVDTGDLEVRKQLAAGSESYANQEFTFTISLSDSTILGEYGDITFNNGVATVKLKAGESAKATGLPAGTTYTVTEEATMGFQNTSRQGDSGSIVKDQTSTATFTNARERGNLKVSKTLAAGSERYSDQEFAFTVTLSDTSITGSFGGMTFDKGVATFTLKGGESATATGLPTGITYEVVESATEGFQNTGTSNASGTISTTDSTAAFTNARATGDLTVSKEVISQATADATKEFTFRVELGDKSITGTYGGMTFNKGVATFALKGGDSVTANGLPTGTTYEVTEEEDAGFELTGKVGDKDSIVSTGSTAVFTNTRKTGELEVQKTVTSQKSDDVDAEFHFTVTLTDTGINGTYGQMDFSNGIATFALKGGGTKSATGLPTDIGYTVIEAEENNGQFTTQKTGHTGTIGTSKSTAAFTNTRTTGDLEVRKTVPNSNTASADVKFSFTVTLDDTGISGKFGEMEFTDGVATFTLKGGETKSANGLPTGVGYTVTEAAAADFNPNPVNREIKGTIAIGTAAAVFTNTRVKKGDLVVSKTVESALEADHTQRFKFTVTLGNTSINGTYGDMKFINGVATFEIGDTESKCATGLPNGTTYTVAETTQDAFTTSSEGEEGTISDGGVAAASFKNTRKTGNLELKKKVVSDAAADKEAQFTFTISLGNKTLSGTFGDATFTNGEATVQLKHNQKAQITNLPVGVGYTITEASAEGFELTGQTGNEGTISTTDSKAQFTNKRTTGNLVLSKKVVSDVPADRDADYTFTIALGDTSINKTYSDVQFINGKATVTLKGGHSKTIEGLPTGISYTVTEATPENFGTEFTGHAGTISTADSEAKFTNTRQTGDLEVSKRLLSGAAADADKEFKFTIKLGDENINKTYGGVEFKDGVGTVRLKGGQSKTVQGLPAGITYTVTEALAEGFSNTGVTGNTGTISTTTSTASFQNTRNTGELELSKVLESGLAADKDQTFTFHVAIDGLTDDAKNAMYSGVQFANGEADVTLKGGEHKVISNLPVGVSYTVSEAVPTGFKLKGRTEHTGTISAVPSVAEFTNTRKTGELTISKQLISEAAADKNQTFTFTVALKGLTDDAMSGTYDGVQFANGEATIVLKGGDSKTISGLPYGAEYEVTEAGVAGFTLTNKSGEKGTISAAASAAKFTNTRETGELTVSKTVISDAAADKDQKFTFTVELSDKTIGGNEGKTYEDMTFKNGVATFELKDGEFAKASGLPTGITYTVVEQSATGFQLTGKTGEAGSISTTPSEVTFTNTKDKGGLVVAKTVISDAAADKAQEFEFTVTLDDATISKKYGDMTFKDGVATFKLKGGESAQAAGLPIGVGYTVTEESVDGFKLTNATGNTGTITKGKTQRAEFTNTRKTGSLQVSKEVISNAAADADQEFTFIVRLSDTTIAGTYGAMTFTNGEAMFTLKNGESATATGLPTGVDYTVTESSADGFRLTGKTGNEGTISTAKSQATFTNTRNTGDLKVSKAIVSDVAADEDQEFNFTVTLSDTTITGDYGKMTFANGVARFALRGGKSKKATGLPTGITYTVTEATADGFTQTAKVGDTGSISTDESVALFTNTRDTGDLEVSKELVSDAAADRDRQFEFTVQLSDASISKTYGGVEFKGGKATVMLRGGESRLIEGLPAGVGYVVTEKGAAGFRLTGKAGDEGTITTARSRATFTNTRETGDLEVSKELVSDAAADQDREFAFTVTLSDNTIGAGVFGKTYGGMTFKNGVATFKLKGGESIKATGLPTGVGYTITEADAEGFRLTGKTGDEGTITTARSRATFTNTRETGDLEVSKKLVSDATADANKPFKFTVTLSDTTIGGKEGKAYGQMTFKNGVATLRLKGGESVIATGLPTNITYTVTEEEAEGFDLTGKTGDTGTISTTKAEATFTNARQTGDLELSKKLVSDAAADKDQAFTFTITLTDTGINKTFSGVVFTGGVATVTLKGGESKLVEGLPTGIGYTITEAATDGYTVASTNEAGSITQDKAVATFTNTRNTGDLEVSKALVSDAAADAGKEFEFTVTLTDNTIGGIFGKTYGNMRFVGGKATFKLKGGESIKATGLPIGVGYTITEADAEGFQLTGATGSEGTISTTKSQATFTNTRETGSLKLSKNLVSDAAADASQEFTFNITLSDTSISKTYSDVVFAAGKATVKLKGGESKLIEGLPTNVTYTVEEAANDAFTTHSDGSSGTISTELSNATFINTRKTGDLKLNKVLVSDAEADASQEFNFTVTLRGLSNEAANKTYGDVEFTGGSASIALKGGESKTIEGLPIGVDYVITEDEVEGFQNTGKVGNAGTISQTLSEATFTNSKDKGGLVVAKTLVSDAAADASQEFTFTITLDGLSDAAKNKTYDGVEFTNGVGTVTLRGGEAKQFDDLPKGITYTVTEADEEGLRLTQQTGTTGTIQKSVSARAEFTNTRTTGKLTISKDVVSNAAADASQEFTFTITLDGLSDAAKNKTYDGVEFTNGVGTVTLKGGETKQIDGLPTSVTYTVTEADADGFQLTGTTGNEGTITTTPATAAFTNTRNTGDLTVSKTVVSDAVADKDQAFTFTVTLSDNTISGTYGNMTFYGGVATFTLKGGDSAKAEGLPTGITYEVTEAANGDFATTQTGQTGIISTGESTAAFTNTRKTGALTVTKSVTSSTPADLKKGFLFKVTLSDTSISGTYGSMSFRNGVATFALAHDQSKTATNLPIGISYTVEETPAQGYVTTYSGETGQITTTGSTAAFTNTKDEGGLLVSKSVTSAISADKTKQFAFTVTLADDTVNGTYGQMTFTNGVATFKLADGKTMLATGLARGIGYTVTEAADNDFNVVSQGETGVIGKVVSEAAFANVRKTGDLTVSKALVSSATADAQRTYDFTVTLANNTINGTFGNMTFIDGVAAVSLKGGESATAIGLPANIGYTVTEAAYQHITATSKDAAGTITEVPSEAAFTNTRQTGELKVSKALVSDAAADASQTFEFTVKLAGAPITGKYGNMQFNGGVATFALKGGESIVATGLPVGVGYTVTEAENGDFVTGATGASGTIATTQQQAAFTNTRKTGDLTVSKTVVSDSAADKNQEFTFTVTLSDKGINGTYGQITFKDGKATVELKGGASATATGLPTGIGYEVTEDKVDGFITTYTGQAGSITTTPAKADFTNTRDKGGLIVSKSVVSGAAADAEQEFNFTVTLSDKTIGGKDGKTYGGMTFINGVAKFALKGGQTIEATGLPTAITYTVEERADDDFVTRSEGTTGTIGKTSASLATFTNTRKTGDLTVSKSVVSHAAADADQLFTFTVALSDTTIAGTYGAMTFDAGKATVQLKGGESATAEGLPTGIDYIVTEATVDGFQNTSKKGEEGTISTTPSVAAFTNTRNTGDLTISKELVSKIAADAELAFEFVVALSDTTINGTYGQMTFNAGKATVELKGGESATAEGLPIGIAYEAVETAASSKGFDVQAQGNTGTIQTTASTASFTNTRLLGSLTIKKQVTMDGTPTTTTAADGSYTFQVTGPGIYEQGITHTISIVNGRSQTLTLNDLFVGDYTISEVTDGLPANMRLLSQSPQTITVESNNEQSIPVAEFHNELKSTQAAFEVTKEFSNWDGAKNSTFSFRLAPVADAPMPQNTLVPNIDVRTATGEQHAVTFGNITYTRVGTYAYKISEVVPKGADENGVFEGISYDMREHDVTVQVTADEDGALHARVTYDEAQEALTITNTYAATGATTLTGTKELAGRPFRDGDTWTFHITQPEGQNGPVPEHEEVTVEASKGNAIDFGTIGNFTFEDVGKTFTYEVRESGAVEDVENDAQVKVVTLEVKDNGDGTLNIVSSTEEEPLTFTNTYLVHEDLIAHKGILGRKWKTNEQGDVAEEYHFELYDGDDASAQKREQSNVSNAAVTHGAAHTAKFGTFTFTSADVGKTFSYTVREVPATEEQVKRGITSDTVMYDAAFQVVEEDGEVKVHATYTYGADEDGNALAKDRLEFVNTYQAAQTKATIQAQKILEGRNMKAGEFQFELYSVAKDGARFKQQTKSVAKAADGEASVVTFDDIDCYEAGTMHYVIREVIPQDATQDKKGNWTKDGITYDTTEQKVKIVVTDDYEGQLHAEVVYEDLKDGDTLPTFTNTYFGAEANIEFNKEYYGANTNAEFPFVFTAANKSFEPRATDASGVITYDPSSITKETPLVDFGQAFTVTQTNGAFKRNLATVTMPTITYHKPGTYRYVITEKTDGQSQTLSADEASILVTVDVDDDAKTTVAYQVRTGDANLDELDAPSGQTPTLYNNELVSMTFRSNALRQTSSSERIAFFEPAVRKVLKNGVLRGGEFQFALYQGSEAAGQALQVVSNDANGTVSFSTFTYSDENVGQTYEYTIAELPTTDETVVTDAHVIRLSIAVTQGDEGQIVATGTYSDVNENGTLTQTDDPTFVNTYDTIIIHAVKRSREEPYDPLGGAHYGLWMVNPDGKDVYMGLGRNQVEAEGSELVSSDNGDLYYDLPLVEGVAYYFLEEWPPPAGHLVDPYPTDYFTLVHDKEAGTFRLVYEADEDFAKYCPGITR